MAANGLDFDITFYDELCNCDSDCGDYSSCLTDDTDDLIMNAAQGEQDKLLEAHDAGHNGVCVSVSLNGEIMIYGMSYDCNSQYDGSTDEPDPNYDITQDDGTDSGNDDTDNQDDTTDDNTDNDGTEDNASRVVQINFDDDTDDGSNNPDQTENSRTDILENIFSKYYGGMNMTALTATIIAGTFVIVGFFSLMAWVAYLLQKKSEPRGK